MGGQGGVENSLVLKALVSASVTQCLDTVKGSSNPSHLIFVINVGMSPVRHTTTLKMNDEFLDRLKID